VLNPYRQFQGSKPAAFIQDGVFVYDGTFDMRFASALGHVTRAQDLTSAGQLAPALVEAQKAVAIDPDELEAKMVLGNTLTALGRPPDAKPAYQQALAIAKTMEPSAEAIWVKTIQRKLAGR
jgi:tetratricopeptide (TPR) repeat protein